MQQLKREQIRQARNANLFEYVFENYKATLIPCDHGIQIPLDDGRIWIGVNHSGYIHYMSDQTSTTGNALDFCLLIEHKTLQDAVKALLPYLTR